MSIRNWSPSAKLAAVIWFVFIVFMACFALKNLTASPTTISSGKVLSDPRPVIHVPGAAHYTWKIAGATCWVRGSYNTGLRVQFFKNSNDELYICGESRV